MLGDTMALVGGGVVLLAFGVWGVGMLRLRLDAARTPTILAMLTGFALGAVGLWWGTSLWGSVGGWVAIAGGGIYLILQSASRQQKRASTVTMGAPMVTFVALTDDGGEFDLASVEGPYLFKLFRGHW